jgi:uncharacterized protein YeaO (DUF488 family)
MQKEDAMIALKRAYEPAEPRDGRRFLVDRLWPRGVKKTDLPLDGWLKTLAPSEQLRKWYGHEVGRWDVFVARYKGELDPQSDEFQRLLKAARAGTITLITATRDLGHSNAAALKQFLEQAA